MTEEPTDDGLRRRRLLQAITASALAPALAGCQTDFEETTTTTAGETTTSTGTGADSTATTTDATTTTVAPGGAPAGVDPCTRSNDGPGPDCNAPERLDFNVTDDTTIGESCNRFVADRDVTVRNGATLTIAPGTVIRFASGTGIEVRDGGSIDAAGTCEEPIEFVGTGDQRGHWGKMLFDGTEGNRLRYCVVENGGGDYDQPGPAAAVAATDGASVAIENCSVRKSVSHGVGFQGQVTVTRFRNNAFTENTLGPAVATPENVRRFTPENDYAGNGTDVVDVVGGLLAADVDHSWEPVGVPYRLDGTLEVEGTLTLRAGVEVRATEGSAIRQRGGSLQVNGEPGSEVLFTATEAKRGHWRGVHVAQSGDAPSAFRNCVVEYAGGETFEAADHPANLVVTSTSEVAMDNCTLRESRGYGLVTGAEVELVRFRENALTRNRLGAAAVVSPVVPQLTTDSTYTGNATDVVEVRVGQPVAGRETTTWPGIDASYRVRGDMTVTGTLAIDPGAVLQFTARSSLTVDGGRLLAEGTRGDPISFTGARQQPGIWRGILFKTTSGESTLRYCDVAFGGGDVFVESDRPANVAVAGNARVSIRDCDVRRSNGYGVTLGASARVESFRDNRIRDNSSGPVFARMGAVRHLSSTTTYAGNDADHVFVQAGSTIPPDEEHAWDALDVPYRVADDVTVRGTLTIEPGATLAFEGENGVLARSGGVLHAVGNPDRRITFTGTKQRRGHWTGIYFERTGGEANQIHYSTVEYGGGSKFLHAGVPANVAVTTESYASIQNCALKASGGYGLHATSGTTVETANNTYRFNDLGEADLPREV